MPKKVWFVYVRKSNLMPRYYIIATNEEIARRMKQMLAQDANNGHPEAIAVDVVITTNDYWRITGARRQAITRRKRRKPKPKTSKIITVRIDMKTYRKLEEIADATGKTISELVREAIKKMIYGSSELYQSSNSI